MNDHMHDWGYITTEGGIKIVCRVQGCGRVLPLVEQLKRINAVERLSTKDALDAAFAINEKEMLTAVVENLEAYAAALEE